MLLCEGLKIDWTAFAALTALSIWLVDGHRRRRERRASRRLLSQIMIAPVGDVQLDIAKLRSSIIPPGSEDTTYLFKVLDTHAGRKEFAYKASLITFELPSQFLDKADLFSELVSNRLALAYSQVNRLRSTSQFLGKLSDTANKDEIMQNLKQILTQIHETEQVIGEAYQVLLKEGRASARFRHQSSHT